jgi:hypothetical protein
MDSELSMHPAVAAIAAQRSDAFDAATESSEMALEVIPIWAGTVMQVAHVVPGRRPAPYLVGEDPTSRFHLSADHLGGAERWTLVMPDGTVRVPPGAEAVVERRGGERLEGDDVESMTRLELGDRMRIRIGSVTFVVRAVHAPARLRLPVALDWRSLSFTAASLALNLVILAAAFLFPPDTRVLGYDEDFEQSRWGKLLSRATVVDVQEMPEWMRAPREEKEMEGGEGRSHKGEEGQMGDRKAKKSDRMYAIKGDADPAEQRLGRIQREDVKKTGILSVLSSTLSMPTSKWGSDTPVGSDLESYLGAHIGAMQGPNFGLGGFGMKGTGDGGNGDGEGTISLVPGAWRIGHGGFGEPGGVGYCPPGQVCGGGLKAKPGGKVPPRVKIKGEGHVLGCIGKEAIRRVIRQHINEVRHCYEKGLMEEPDLEGRVSVGFVIKGDGAVGGAKIKDSTLGSKPVESCITKAIERWTFPAPEGCGVVIVSYPFSFVPASS